MLRKSPNKVTNILSYPTKQHDTEGFRRNVVLCCCNIKTPQMFSWQDRLPFLADELTTKRVKLRQRGKKNSEKCLLAVRAVRRFLHHCPVYAGKVQLSSLSLRSANQVFFYLCLRYSNPGRNLELIDVLNLFEVEPPTLIGEIVKLWVFVSIPIISLPPPPHPTPLQSNFNCMPTSPTPPTLSQDRARTLLSSISFHASFCKIFLWLLHSFVILLPILGIISVWIRATLLSVSIF